MHAAVVERAELEADLQRVIERDELVLRYLPVVALESAAMTGIETLVRWRHPERGLSACRLGAADLTADVAAALGLSGLEPSSLVLEITETALMRDVDDDDRPAWRPAPSRRAAERTCTDGCTTGRANGPGGGSSDGGWKVEP